MSSEEHESETQAETQRKKPRTSAGGAGSVKATIAELQKQKKVAVKNEDYAEALRLKKEIDDLTAKATSEAAAKAEAKAAAKASPPSKGVKRSAPDGKSPPKEEEPKKPMVEELEKDPFFDDGKADFVAPTCVTAREREAWRAVYHCNYEFLARKVVGSLPLFCQRDVVSRQTAFHLAIEKGDTKCISLLAQQAMQNGMRESIGSGRANSLSATSTGTPNCQVLGFETGKIGVARGGRELNNALVDPNEKPDPMHIVIGRSPLSADQVQLLIGLKIINDAAVCRRGKIKWCGGNSRNPYTCNMGDLVEPALRRGRFGILQALIPKFSSFGAGPAHQAAVKDDPLPSLQGRSVTAKLRFGNITPVHLAAVNPDGAKIGEMLKIEPTALGMPTESGLYPIHCAAACEGPGPLKVLLSEWNADRRQQTTDKRTPLHFAAEGGRLENVRLLMGGSGMGKAAGTLFTKEIRAILARQKTTMKIAADGICILSRLLVDLVHRIITDAKGKADNDGDSGMEALQKATREVLKGGLAPRIRDKARKLAAGKLGLPKATSKLAKTLSDVGEDAVQAMFNKVDKNGNGTLERAEIRAVLESAGIKLSKKQFAKVMKDIDSDGNGDVSLEEFSSWIEAGSAHAVALRRHLIVDVGELGQVEVAEAEAAADDELLQGVDKLAFNAQPLLQLLECPGLDDKATKASAGQYVSAILECTCTRVLEISANAAKTQKKTSIGQDHLLNAVKSNEDLHALYQADSVVMNSLLLQAKDKEGYQALHRAAEAGHAEVVEALLACGADADAPGPERKCALAIASERGHSACVKALLAAGAKIDVPDKRKRTALLLAVRSGHTVTASILLHAGANPNAADDSGNTVVHYAAAFGWKDCLELLHKAGAILSTANAMKLVPITAALQKGHKTVFRKMLELGIDVNFRDADGSTLLLRCLGSVNRLVHEEVKFMLSLSADPNLNSSATKTTALHEVARATIAAGHYAGDAYVAHPFEGERLKKVAGWKARPRDKSLDFQMGLGVSEDAQEPAAKRAKTADDEVDPIIHRRGFHQLSIAEREAVFQLGFTQQTWQSGDNPTQAWKELTDGQRTAAAALGLNEATWPALEVRIVIGQRDEDGTLPVDKGMAVGACEESGVVSIRKYDDDGKVSGSMTSYHISRVLLPHEDVEDVWRQTPHVTVAIARLLLEQKAVVDARDASGTTPLMLTVNAANTDLAMLLLDEGADPNAAQDAPKLTPEQLKLPQPRPLTPLVMVSSCPRDFSLTRGVWSIREVVIKLLAKGCKTDDPATVVDPSPMLHFARAGDFQSAALLFEAKADPSADRSGNNALHILFGKLFSSRVSSWTAAWRKSMHTPFALAMQLLLSPQWGAKLMDEHTRTEPHVTPLHTLVSSFASSFASGVTNISPNVHAQLLYDVLEAIPGSVNFGGWTKPAEVKPSTGAAMGTPCGTVQTAQSPLSILCACTPLESCPDLGVAVVELLCKRGVSPNATPGSPAAVHSLAQRLGSRLAQSSLARVLLPLTDMSARLTDGNTLLTFVLRSGNTNAMADAEKRQTVKLLLDSRCDPDLPDEPVGLPAQVAGRAQRPLHIAAHRRDEGLLQDLLAGKADPNLVDNEVSHKVPLHFAISAAPTGATASFDIEEVLITGKADPCAVDANGWTALHYAFLKDESGAFAHTGPWVREVKATEHSPVMFEWTDSAKGVLNKRIDPIETVSSLCAVVPGSLVNAKDKHGMGALHLAALRGASISALKLISAGASLEDEFQGNTPLGLAMHQYPDMAVLLMQRNADTTRMCIMFGGMQTQTSPSTAPESIFSLALRRIATLGVVDQASTYLGAAIAAMDCGYPRSKALNDTIASRQFIMLLTLIGKVGDDILRTQRFEGGHNVLHRLAAHATPDGADEARSKAFIQAARKFLDRGVPIDTNDDGQTPLHLAASAKHKDLVSLLLSKLPHGDDLVRIADRSGLTALGCALHSGNQQGLAIAKELIAHGASAKNALVDVESGRHALSYCIAAELQPYAWKGECWPRVLFAKEHPDLLALDVKKQSCLALAARAAQYSVSYLRLIVRWAADAGGDVFAKLVKGKDDFGFTPLMHAVVGGRIFFVDQLLKEAHVISPQLVRDMLTAQAPDGSTPLMLAVDSSDCVGMACTLLRCTDDVVAPSMLAVVDTKGHSALIKAVLRNSTPLVKSFLRGRPVRPAPTQTSCPAGKMAGQRALARVVYKGATCGAPNFTIQWLGEKQDKLIEAVADDADGWVSVTLHVEKGGAAKGEVPSGSRVLVKSTAHDWCEVDTRSPLGSGYILSKNVRNMNGSVLGGSPDAVQYIVELEMPPGSGPGVNFDVDWAKVPRGPGDAGLASGFADDAAKPPRAPAAAIGRQDERGWTALHHCVCPLAFGSFENTDILAMLVKAGISPTRRSRDGQTAPDLASRQSSGRMAQCFKELNVAAPKARPMDVDLAGEWPQAVDVKGDAAKALQDCQAKRKKVHGKVEPPVEKHFAKPSAASRVAVANGTDGQPLDLVMTKVDLSRPFCPQNVFYRMQVVHELNQDHYYLFTRWGGIGTRGQFQTSPFESLEKAEAEFRKIFKSKAANDWSERAAFAKKPGKYQLHEITYDTKAAAQDALSVEKWKRLPSKTSPVEFRRLLNVASYPGLLRQALEQANVHKPLGNLKTQSLCDAKEMLGKISVLLRQADAEKAKEEPSGEKFQAILEEIAELCSRLYELFPTKDFSVVASRPIQNRRHLQQWYQRLDQTDDITCAAALLLGAQAKIGTMSPTDYIYHGLSVRVMPLPSESEELHLIERYINRSQPHVCRLFSGPGALELPKRDPKDDFPRWQVVQEVVCYTSPECRKEFHAQIALVPGCLVREYATHNGFILITTPTPEGSAGAAAGAPPKGTWVKPVGDDGTEALTKLTERQANSRVAAVYRIDRRGEENRASGDSTLLFHGSGMPNFLSILSQGLRIKPPGAQQSGSAFGNGIYFANSFQKSLGYSAFDTGTGFMLLCEVAQGRPFATRQFNFMQVLEAAHMQAARTRLKLPADANVDDHPELKAAHAKIHQEIATEEIVDFTGTAYDSIHFQSEAAPDKSGDVMHPDGYKVPCGEIVRYNCGTIGGGPRDEIIVYDPARARLRYLIEMRDPSIYNKFVACSPPDDKGDEEMAAAPATQGGDSGPDDDDEEEEKEEEAAASVGQEDDEED